jgi:hypothetical protein
VDKKAEKEDRKVEEKEKKRKNTYYANDMFLLFTPQHRNDYKGATCLCVFVLHFVLKNRGVADNMPLYIKAPAVSSYIGTDETWC